MDNDCDQQVDEGLLNRCGTCGEVPAEVCDVKDNDCDGRVDEDVDAAPSWYPDCDFDGYAPFFPPVRSCGAPRASNGCGWTNLAPVDTHTADCDDALVERHPQASYGILTDALLASRRVTELDRALYWDLDCDGVAEGAQWAVALWDDKPIDKPLKQLPACAQGVCPCLQQSLSIPQDEPRWPCWMGTDTLVRLADEKGQCLPVTNHLVITLCR